VRLAGSRRGNDQGPPGFDQVAPVDLAPQTHGLVCFEPVRIRDLLTRETPEGPA
jgi:hypothetical protein